MKTNNLTKRSFLMLMILALSAGFGLSKKVSSSTASPNGYIGGGSPIFFPKRTKFKGYMREKRRFNTYKG